MALNSWLKKLPRKARWPAVLAAGAAFLLMMNWARLELGFHVARSGRELAALENALVGNAEAVEASHALREMRAKDLDRYKADLSRLTQSRRAVYEGGLLLQEELRLLQKQWEIMTTYLLVDEDARKIHLMRGEQSLESYPIEYAPPMPMGGQSKSPPPVAAVFSKERFAHPERGKSEEIGGQMIWEPPQVGSSPRANALGEIVVFARGGLILHGPPKDPREHEAFPHHCLGLTQAVARKLYARTFIGTKIVLKKTNKR